MVLVHRAKPPPPNHQAAANCSSSSIMSCPCQMLHVALSLGPERLMLYTPRMRCGLFQTCSFYDYISVAIPKFKVKGSSKMHQNSFISERSQFQKCSGGPQTPLHSTTMQPWAAFGGWLCHCPPKMYSTQ